MKLSTTTIFATLAQLCPLTLAAASYGKPGTSWSAATFKSLVAFGDSYTDDSRLSYFIAHNGSAPPVGWMDPANYNAADGGRPWPQYVYQYANITPYNYAVAGAVCSNDITPRYLSALNGLFPDIKGYEIPAFLADKAYINSTTGEPFLDIPTYQTVYTMWIGTNDLGVDAMLTDSQVAGTNITSYIDCVYHQTLRLYNEGARFFVLFNMLPLQDTPLYGLPNAGGVSSDNYWPNKTSEVNITAASYRMLEQIVTVNEIYLLRTAVEVQLERKFIGAKFAVYNVNKLITDIHDNPSMYLNGTAPLSVTTPDDVCNATDSCVKNDSPDSFLWYDDLHPSEQTERWIAKEFLGVLNGTSDYATYFEY